LKTGKNQTPSEALMPQQIRAIVVDPTAPGRLGISTVPLRDPDRDEVAVRVTAISLNRGETRRALQVAEPGWRPGWDFAGVVESAASDGSGPVVGTRVVGLLPSGAWAERVNCRSHAVAALPEGCSDAQAATLPVAGLTALHALRQGGLLLGRKVLVDGASGGVGHLACQLAAAAGALVWGHVRREEARAQVAEWTRGRVVVSRDLAAAKQHGPYWLILDSVGGSALSAALAMLAPNGTCVTFGVSEGSTVTFDSGEFFRSGRPRLYGLYLFDELMSVERGGIGLRLLAELIAAGKLRPEIAVEAPWSEIGTIARRLIDRDFTGKAVLHVG
jgi:NADPH:quinone reductase-like Zn-dependent oxidoreductase